ncbi:MAG TPA: small ribosomal subunit Rsm22 family protein [Oligoflexia bacterium]|nr:small ribosomal subunit Rsm22 family protein [Oligoflexia bacterium]
MLFYEKDVTFPNELSTALEVALAENGQTFSAREINRLGDTLSRLWPELAEKRGIAEQNHYSHRKEFAATYAAYYLPANLLKWACVLDEVQFVAPLANESTKICDFGCGPGTVYWGAAWWHWKMNRKLEFVGIDQSHQFSGLAPNLAQSLERSLGAQAGTLRARWIDRKLTLESILETVKTERPTMVTFSNALAEIAPKIEDREKIVLALLKTLSVLTDQDSLERKLILLEPASISASRELLELRARLIAHEGVHVELPCLNNRPCGALAREGDWCHEEIAVRFPEWMNQIGKQAGLKKENLLFSYLVLGQKAQTGRLARLPRVVSHRFVEKGLTKCWICTETGKRQIRLLNSRKNEKNESFEGIRRGDLIEELTLSEKSDVQSLLLFRDLDEVADHNAIVPS